VQLNISGQLTLTESVPTVLSLEFLMCWREDVNLAFTPDVAPGNFVMVHARLTIFAGRRQDRQRLRRPNTRALPPNADKNGTGVTNLASHIRSGDLATDTSGR
jgi:hypothetical protein